MCVQKYSYIILFMFIHTLALALLFCTYRLYYVHIFSSMPPFHQHIHTQNITSNEMLHIRNNLDKILLIILRVCKYLLVELHTFPNNFVVLVWLFNSIIASHNVQFDKHKNVSSESRSVFKLHQIQNFRRRSKDQILD